MSLQPAAIRGLLYRLAVRGLLVAFLARALVPAGFMPDAEAAAHGVVQLMPCTEHLNTSLLAESGASSHATETTIPQLFRHPSPPKSERERTSQSLKLTLQADEDPPFGRLGIACEFAAVTSYVAAPAVCDLQKPVVYAGHRTWWHLRTAPIALSRTAGPALGSRGPPQSFS